MTNREKLKIKEIEPQREAFHKMVISARGNPLH